MLALAAAGGFVSLSYEIFFFRTVSYASGSSATAFAATLSAFLVGLASGARQAGEHCETLSRGQAIRRAIARPDDGEPRLAFCSCRCSTILPGSTAASSASPC